MSSSTYNTKQKKLILNIMQSNKHRSLSCEEITLLLHSNGTPVGKTTVYRQLERLSGEGVIKRIPPNVNSKTYLYQFLEENMDCESHMHLRCISCGKYEHLGCDFMSKVSEHIFKHHNFTVDNARTEILGVCRLCAAKKEVEGCP